MKIVETKHQKKSWKTSNKNFFVLIWKLWKLDTKKSHEKLATRTFFSSDMKIVETKNQESFMFYKPEANGSQSWYLMRSFEEIIFKKGFDVFNIK